MFVDQQVRTTAPADGTSVDVPAARQLLVSQWLTAPRPVQLPTTVVTPSIGQDEVDRVVREVARLVATAPVTVQVADQSAELPVSVLTAAASFVPKDGTLTLQMDGKLLVDAVMARTTDLLTPAADAQFSFVNDKPVVRPGHAGHEARPRRAGQGRCDRRDRRAAHRARRAGAHRAGRVRGDARRRSASPRSSPSSTRR